MTGARGLRTIPQFCRETGLSRYAVDTLIRVGRLEYVVVVERKMIPDGAYERFIDANTVKSCPAEIPVHASASSTSAASTMSSGRREVAAGSAARALQIAARLKSRSPRSSTPDSGEPALVIPMKR